MVTPKQEQQAITLIKEGKTSSYIRDTVGIGEDAIRKIKKVHSLYKKPTKEKQPKYTACPHLPPVENAIRMLECNKTHKQVEYQWGSEVLAEALTFHTIQTLEEYKEEYKL